ncbi:tRNA (adenosine(37)-N6)-dimethylallyltransferase MiaA [Muricauda sp. JGD-17]|uniref:tRNA dimethylallyltransferase n=1 Tax=Flagellimonas ochracea TaxID=2696472 RepID=A0A964T9H4_9FLAO|nr:tRNA (adenosine(37)-N6)-dimethylallyltransferase MiaA [Allomuricauda ochracea]NAY90720.1 tRNA (adenosine(37)-N6)-dimethylallyltransferase MiaA [Allomuricauda ochracea]
MSNKVLIAIVGPTAIGKTSLGIFLANHFETEIISADSRQFFKEMEIGTAAPSAEELNQVPHHFIQHKSIQDSYSVGDFEKEALDKLDELFQNQNIVILVGGSGLYVDAVIQGLDQFPKIKPGLRDALNLKLKEHGLVSLQEDLKKYDPEYHKIVDLENPHRLIRALEVSITANRPYSSFLNQKKEPRPFQHLYVGLHAPREVIYERINLRVDQMMEAGLLEEVKRLYPQRNLNALQTVGYRELFDYMDAKYTLDFAISEIKKNTRRFAKRQLTWLRKNPEILWVDHDAKQEDILKLIMERLKSMEHAT